MRQRTAKGTWVAAMLFIFIVAAVPAAAEVMDKEPNLANIWMSSLLLAVAAFAAGRLHPLLGIVLLFVPNVPLGVLFELHDPFVGPSIRAEAGMGYIAQAYAANGLVALSYAVGLALFIRKRQHLAHSDESRSGGAEPLPSGQ